MWIELCFEQTQLRRVQQLRQLGLMQLRFVAMTLYGKAKIQSDPDQRDDERIDELIERAVRRVTAFDKKSPGSAPTGVAEFRQ